MRIGPDLQRECDDLGISIYAKPLPPVRQPMRLADGSLVLDFASEPERQKFKQKCASTVTTNCLNGARAACSLKTVDKCRGPGWLRWLGWKPNKSWAEIEACEEQYMQRCVDAKVKSCEQHAESFCELVVAPKQSQQPARK